MKHYFGYIRVSTPKQGQTGVSLQEQRTAIEQYARRHNLAVDRWYEDQVTAAKRGRRVFERMLRERRKAGAAGVIVHKIDRSARNFFDWADMNDLMDEGVEIHIASENRRIETRDDRLAADVQAVVAVDYIRNLREETIKGFYGRLKQGLYPLKAPLGYLDRGRGKAKEIDPVHGPLIRWAFEAYATGAFTLDSLSLALAEKGWSRAVSCASPMPSLTARSRKKSSKAASSCVIRSKATTDSGSKATTVPGGRRPVIPTGRRPVLV